MSIVLTLCELFIASILSSNSRTRTYESSVMWYTFWLHLPYMRVVSAQIWLYSQFLFSRHGGRVHALSILQLFFKLSKLQDVQYLPTRLSRLVFLSFHLTSINTYFFCFIFQPPHFRVQHVACQRYLLTFGTVNQTFQPSPSITSYLDNYFDVSIWVQCTIHQSRQVWANLIVREKYSIRDRFNRENIRKWRNVQLGPIRRFRLKHTPCIFLILLLVLLCFSFH